ncbi:Flp family type IVb pilin [Thermotomaculum hydrothermale]|uniref:Flp family type IVb pilin n=1 Tax=Thermotomaculum hydrothermale TaxID=981385 RepID=UPI0019157F6F|nr:Flp family type IVb pilin [Thermotomaculum hydrothermale]
MFRLLGLTELVKGFDLKSLAKRFHEDETGQGMTEYIIIIVLVAILVLFVVKAFGGKIKGLFKKSTETLGSETEGAFQGS